MRLPRAVGALLVMREMDPILPNEYCKPQCPSCRIDCLQFNEATSCQANSTFIANCGGCQQCVLAYSIQQSYFNLTLPDPRLQPLLSTIVDLCRDSPVSTEVAALQSQASRIISMGVALSTSMAYAATASHSTATANPSASPKLASPTASPTTSPTSIPVVDSNSDAPLSKTWVVGPVIGSLLGIATVLVVIYFTRKRQQRKTLVVNVPAKESDDDESTECKAQLHSECMPVGELENTEVIPPTELPAVEPTGTELNTPMDEDLKARDWPLPRSPLTVLFAMTELRDERAGSADSPKHETFYHS